MCNSCDVKYLYLVLNLCRSIPTTVSQYAERMMRCKVETSCMWMEVDVRLLVSTTKALFPCVHSLFLAHKMGDKKKKHEYITKLKFDVLILRSSKAWIFCTWQRRHTEKWWISYQSGLVETVIVLRSLYFIKSAGIRLVRLKERGREEIDNTLGCCWRSTYADEARWIHLLIHMKYRHRTDA